MLAIMSIMGWSTAVADASTAFLQGDPQRRELWARLPKDACQILNVPAGSLMKLVKPIYGQADAPKAWHVVAKRRLESVGFLVHPLDGCLSRLFDEENNLTARKLGDELGRIDAAAFYDVRMYVCTYVRR